MVRALDEALAAMERWTVTHHPRAVPRTEEALERHLADRLDGATVDRLEEIGDLDEVISDIAAAATLFDQPLPDGRTPIEAYLAAPEAAGLDPPLRRFLEAASRSHLAPWEVTEVARERHAVLRDLLDGHTVEVFDRELSRRTRPGTVLLTRIAELDGAGRTLHDSVHLEAGTEKGLVRHLSRERETTGLDWPAYAKRHWMEVVRWWLEALAWPPLPPDITNTDGDPLLYIVLRYPVRPRRRGRLVRALEAVEGVERAGNRRWTYERPSRHGRSLATVRARLELDGRTLVVTVNSERREAEIRALLERVADGLLDPPRREAEPFTLRHLPPEEPGEVDEADPLPPELERRLIHEVFDEHYRGWVDKELPALGGLSPRQAAATPAGRARVRRLLEGLEAALAEMGEPAASYDTGWLWRELGLRRDHER